MDCAGEIEFLHCENWFHQSNGWLLSFVVENPHRISSLKTNAELRLGWVLRIYQWSVAAVIAAVRPDLTAPSKVAG